MSDSSSSDPLPRFPDPRSPSPPLSPSTPPPHPRLLDSPIRYRHRRRLRPPTGPKVGGSTHSGDASSAARWRDRGDRAPGVSAVRHRRRLLVVRAAMSMATARRRWLLRSLELGVLRGSGMCAFRRAWPFTQRRRKRAWVNGRAEQAREARGYESDVYNIYNGALPGAHRHNKWKNKRATRVRGEGELLWAAVAGGRV